MGVLWLFMGGASTTLFGGAGRKSIFRTAAAAGQIAGGSIGNGAALVGRSMSYALTPQLG
jgi:hypothetical protein